MNRSTEAYSSTEGHRDYEDDVTKKTLLPNHIESILHRGQGISPIYVEVEDSDEFIVAMMVEEMTHARDVIKYKTNAALEEARAQYAEIMKQKGQKVSRVHSLMLDEIEASSVVVAFMQSYYLEKGEITRADKWKQVEAACIATNQPHCLHLADEMKTKVFI